jgi:hypothetical protein
VSTFGVTTPASIRYTITDPNAVGVLDQSISFDAFNGDDLLVLPLNLSAGAATGTYTFRATTTYQDNTAAIKTSTQTTTFVVGSNPPPLAPTITTQRLSVMDINGVMRSSFSNGERLPGFHKYNKFCVYDARCAASDFPYAVGKQVRNTWQMGGARAITRLFR